MIIAMDKVPRPPYMHPDGEYVSVGFGTENDSLLKVTGGDGDRARIEEWCNAVSEMMRRA